MATAAPAGGYPDRRPWLVVHPEIPWLRYAGLAAVWTAVIMVGTWLPGRHQPFSGIERLTIAGVTGAFLLLGAARLYMISRLSRLRVGRDGLIFVNSFGVSRVLARHSLTKIVIASFTVTFRYSATFTYYLFLDRDGRAVLTLRRKWWPEEGIDAVGQALGVLVTGTLGTSDGTAFRRQFPGSITWADAHPLLSGTFLLLVAIIAISVLMAIVTGQA